MVWARLKPCLSNTKAPVNNLWLYYNQSKMNPTLH